MRLTKRFGWESFLIISVYAGLLRVLPLPKVVVWSISLFLLVIAVVLFVGKEICKPTQLNKNILIVLSLFLLLIAWAIISLLWSPISLEYLVSNDALILIVVVIPALVLLFGGSRLPGLEVRCVSGLAIVLFPIFLYILIIWLSSDVLLYKALLTVAYERESVGNIYLGVCIALILCSIGCILWVFYAHQYQKQAFIVGILAFFLAIQSGGRGPIISGILSLLVILLLSVLRRRGISRKRMQTLFAVLIIVTVSLVVLNMFFAFNLFYDEVAFTQRFVKDLDRDLDDSSSIGHRITLYSDALSLIANKPIIGNGALSFRTLTSSQNSIYPHNILLDVWGDLGIIGAALFVLLILIGIRSCWVIVRKSDSVYSVACAAFFLFFLIESQFSGYMYWSQLWVWLAIVVVCSQEITDSNTI